MIKTPYNKAAGSAATEEVHTKLVWPVRQPDALGERI